MKILINTEWFSAIQDLSKEKQLEILEAIMDYPNRESDTNIWKKVIKPQLETGKIAYYNKINNLKQYRSTERDTDTDTDSVTDTDTRTESNINKSNINNNNTRISISNNNTTHVRTNDLTPAQKKEKIATAIKHFGRFVGQNQILITADFQLPDNDYFKMYRENYPKETESVVAWIKKTKMYAVVDFQWIGKQIQNFHKKNTGKIF